MDGSDRPGERLAHHADSWEDLKASPEVVKLIRYRHKISFHKKPPLSEPKPEFATTAPLKQLDVIRKEVKVLVKKGAMRKVPYAEAMKSKGMCENPNENPVKVARVLNFLTLRGPIIQDAILLLN